MKYIFPFIILFFFQLSLAQQNDFEGSYKGVFSFGNFQSDLGLDIQKTNDQYDIQFTSLDQNAFGIPARDIKIHQDSLKFALPRSSGGPSRTASMVNFTSSAVNASPSPACARATWSASSESYRSSASATGQAARMAVRVSMLSHSPAGTAVMLSICSVPLSAF